MATMVDFTSTAAMLTAVSTSILVVSLPALSLLYQLFNPTILSFPWTSSFNKTKDKKTTVVFAGSFNPPHNGHLVMIQYLAMRYKEVIVVIGMNPNKTYLVQPETRADIVRKMVDTLELSQECNVRVKVVSGYIWRYAMANNAKILFRGIRTWEKDGGEERALHILNLWGPLLYGPMKWPVPTHYLEGNPKYTSLSSTVIRDRCRKIKSTLKEKTNSNDNNNGTSSNLNDGSGDSDNDDLNLRGLVPKEVEMDIINAYC
mmetsp:Transcript_15442/g.19593  ORF Transcript_15442/g.19593 Transcript_15442/m.19593 type:complete len:259 (+) Transcript_15442:103-879(+)